MNKNFNYIRRAAAMLLMMLLTATTAWAATENLGGYDNLPAGYKVTWVSDDVTITNGVFTMPNKDVSVTAIIAIDSDHFSQDDVNTYTIHDEEGWGYFCDLLANNDKGIFSGKTVKLDADIEVTCMAGSDYHDFTGTFDGNKKTLTFNYGTAENPANADYAAPFHNVENGNIQNLHVSGHIYTSKKYAAGIAGKIYGTVNISNCRSSIIVYSSTAGDGTHGGFVAANNGTLTITGCLFDGKLLTTGTTDTGNCAGFVAWGGDNVSISNSLYAPATIETTNGEKEVVDGTGDYPGRTFARDAVGSVSNCYYTRTLGTAQGKQARSITAGDNVTVALSGTATEYTVSGITAYGLTTDPLLPSGGASGGLEGSFSPGLKYGDVIYAANGEEVSLTLDHTELIDRNFIGYTADKGTLTGTQNPYTLTMPDDNVTVNAVFGYTIDIPGTSHGSATASVNGIQTTNAHYKDIVTLTISPDTGYMIEEVLVNNEELYPTDGVYSFEMPARNVQVIVYFDHISYGINIADMTHGSVTVPSTAHYNDQIILNITPEDGYAVKYIKCNDTFILPKNGGYSFCMPAEDVTITAEFDIPKAPVNYLDENGEQQSVSVYDVLNGDETELETGWYVLNDDIDWNSSVNVRGDVFLILGDDCTFNAQSGGVDVPQDYSLTIYAQSDSDSMGSLIASAANGDPSAAGIGGTNQSAGTITINGGNIYAKGGQHSAGIGGGRTGSGGTITINGGTVNAYGNSVEDIHDQGGAGIGGGTGGSAGTITINGGTVNAEGDGYASGIGVGKGGSGGTVTINGGQVTASCETNGDGGINVPNGTITLGYTNAMDHIYASSYKGTVKVADGKQLTDGANIYDSTTSSDILSALTNATLTPADARGITVGSCEHGTVTAPKRAFKGDRVTVSVQAEGGYKLINVRYNDTPIRPENGVYTFTMPDEEVVLTATFMTPKHPVIYLDENDETQTAVYYEVLTGSETKLYTGWYFLDSNVAYSGRITVLGDVTLILGDDCTFNASNGGINVSSGNSLTIYAQSVTESEHLGVLNAKATAEKYSGIGGGDNQSGGTVTINGGNIIAYGENYAAGIGGGDLGSGGSFTLNNGKVNATSRYDGAGIGGGYGGYGGDVIINGGELYAKSGGYCAGIGSGANRPGGNITINGGTITAIAGEQAAGIGGGFNGNSGKITINGGNISVTGGDAGSGIGSGYARDVDEITINGGTVNVTAVGEGAAIGDAKLGSGGKITINGGKISATGDQGAGIGGDGCTVTLGYTDDEDFIYASSYAGTVKIAEGKAFTDGPNTYTSDTSSDILSALTDTTLTPAEFYDITVEESAYGTVTAPAQGAAGSIVTLTVQPDNGCSVSYVRYNGTDIEPEGGVYAFEMPYEAVTITAQFISHRVSVAYLDENGEEQTVMALPVSADDETFDDDWYAVTEDVVNNNRISTSGNVHLILCDNKTFTNPQGITVGRGQSLTVHGQSEGTGTWNIDEPESGNAGIGGSNAECVGTVTINGGVINVTGGEFAAGIGGGAFSDDQNGEITINGGTITATSSENGVGIGGDNSSVILTYTNNVSITSDSYSGTVTLEKPFTDGTNIYPAGEVSVDAIAGKTLVPVDGMTVRYAGHALSLDGDIGVNFYVELSDEIAHSETAYMQFTIPNGDKTETQTVKVSEAVKDGDYYVFKCSVAAKEMASQIKAQMINPDNGKQGTVYTYSVKEYADYLLAHTDDSYQYRKAAPMVKAMLNYGTAAQFYFGKTSTGLANTDMSDEDCTLGEITDELDAWADTGTSIPGTTFGGATLSLKSQTTLSLYFTDTDELTFSCVDEKGKVRTVETVRNGSTQDDENETARMAKTVGNGSTQIARIRNIAAAELQYDYTLTVKKGDTELGSITFSPMDYCYKALHGGTQNKNLKNVVTALYWYSEAAKVNSYENVVDLGTLTGNYEAQNGDVLTGTLTAVTAQYKENKKITIADGATVTLRDADITCLNNDDMWDDFAGITLLGDATIILEGTNTVIGGYGDNPGILVPVSHTLTIDGDGSLEVSTNGYGCGIGGRYNDNAGSIVIKGGDITAEGGNNCAAIGSSCSGVCGDITISGGSVIASSSFGGAGIGSGTCSSSECGTITITGGYVEAYGGTNGAGIGSGEGGNCSDIIITGGHVEAYGGYAAPGIGCGYKSDYGATCGEIKISGGNVKAQGGNFAAGIGTCAAESTIGTVTISGGSVEAYGGNYGAGIGSGQGGSCSDILINGGTVTAEGGQYGAGIGSGGKGSTGATCGDITIYEDIAQYTAKRGYNAEDIGCGHEGTCGTVSFISSTPTHATLADNADNTAVINDKNGRTCATVTLSGRTLYKDGAWNTLCLPFDLVLEGSPFEGDNVKAMTLDKANCGLSGTTLILNFTKATTIPAGTPFIIKWDGDGTDNLVDPVFTNVTIDNTKRDTRTDYVSFIGTYSPTDIYTEEKTNLYLGSGNTLYYPWADGMTSYNLNACRAYFHLRNGLTAGGQESGVRIMLRFVEDPSTQGDNYGDDGEASGITTTISCVPSVASERSSSDTDYTDLIKSDEWYSLDGRKLSGKPTKKGMYINNGRKVVIK